MTRPTYTPSAFEDDREYSGQFLRALGNVVVSTEVLRRALQLVDEATVETRMHHPIEPPAWTPSNALDVAAWVGHARELIDLTERILAAAPDRRPSASVTRFKVRTAPGVLIICDAEYLESFSHRLKRHARLGDYFRA